MRLLFKTLEPREGTPTFLGSSSRGIWTKAGEHRSSGEVGYLTCPVWEDGEGLCLWGLRPGCWAHVTLFLGAHLSTLG